MSVTRCHPLAETVLPVPVLCLEAPMRAKYRPATLRFVAAFAVAQARLTL